jgi:hypothetical protein
MFWRCLSPICDGDIGNSLIWVLLVWHFKGRPSSFMFCKFMLFSMESLKLTKTFMGGFTITSLCIHFKFVKDVCSMYPMLLFTCPSLGYIFLIIHSFIYFKERFDIITYWTFFVCVSCDNNVTFLF